MNEELTVEKAKEAYEKTGWKPVDGVLVGYNMDEQRAGGPCGCIVGTLYAADKGYSGDLAPSEKTDVDNNSEWYVQKKYGVNIGFLESGFDRGYVYKREGAQDYAFRESMNRYPEIVLGWQIAQAITEPKENKSE